MVHVDAQFHPTPVLSANTQCSFVLVNTQAAAAAEVQTELASRVSNWRHKIQPLLDEQDARPAFDIHYYGDQILDRLARLSCTDAERPVESTVPMVSLK